MAAPFMLTAPCARGTPVSHNGRSFSRQDVSADVRFGSLAATTSVRRHGRYQPNNDTEADALRVHCGRQAEITRRWSQPRRSVVGPHRMNANALLPARVGLNDEITMGLPARVYLVLR